MKWVIIVCIKLISYPRVIINGLENLSPKHPLVSNIVLTEFWQGGWGGGEGDCASGLEGGISPRVSSCLFVQ